MLGKTKGFSPFDSKYQANAPSNTENTNGTTY